MTKQIRSSNIEILRIIAMIMIVFSHYVVHGHDLWNGLDMSINLYIIQNGMVGSIGVIIFVIISGYFMINQTKIKLKKVVQLVLQTMFYSICCYGLVLILNVYQFNSLDLLHAIFPITTYGYWFMSIYVVMYLISPFINKMLRYFSRKKHLTFIFILMAITVAYFAIGFKSRWTLNTALFVELYSIGAYLHMYPDNFFSKKKNMWGFFLGSISFMMVFVISCDYLEPLVSGKIYGFWSIVYERCSPLAILLSICLVNIFLSFKTKNSKVINFISSYTLGIYLIHDNDFIRMWLWKDIIKADVMFASPYMILHFIGTCFLVFLICLIIEMIRHLIFDYIIHKGVDPICDKLQNLYEAQ